MTAIRYGNLHVQLLVQHGTRVDRVELETPAPRLRVSGLGQAAPATGAPLVGRGDLLDRLAGLAHPGWAVELRAACGFGKSSLLAALATRLAASTAAPAVHLRVGALPPDDILDQLVGALFTADQPFWPTSQQRSGLLGNVRAVVVLDDVTLEPQQLAEVAAALPQCLVLLGSEQPVLDAGGVSVALQGLAEPAGLQLIARDLGRPLGQSEADDAARLCVAVRGQPLRLRQAAALAANGQHSLQRLADRAERDPAALDRLSVHALADNERRVLAVLALAAGAVLPGELVEVISGVDDLATQLDKLRRHGLVEQDHDRFGLPRCLGAGYRKLLVANLDLGAAARSLTSWLAQRDPSSTDALAAASAAVQLVGRLAERGDWPELARLAEVTARVLTLAGRWELCWQVLQQGLHAAQQLGDMAAQARFAHDLGSMALCTDQLQQAEELLDRALALREQLGDHEGAALTRHNRELMTPPGPPPPPPPPDGRRERWERWRKRLPTLASLLGLLVFLLILGLRVIAPAQTTSTTTTSPNPTTTTRTSPPTTSGRPGGPGIATPGTVRFPSIVVGAATTRAFPIGSTGTGPLRLGGFEVTGDRADFAVDGHCRHLTLRPGQSCRPTVTFTPTAEGRRRATLVIHQNLPGPATRVLLTGTGLPTTQPPRLKPSRRHFGSVDISAGHPSIGHTFTVVNPNTRPLGITGANVTGDPAFSVSKDGCSASTLAPQGSCTVTVVFSPTRLGARTGILTISSAQGGSSTAELTGSGFVQLTLTVSKYGTVGDDQGHTCSGPATCTTQISAPDQASITLTATPDYVGYFVGWGGACSGKEPTCHLDLTEDTAVSAKFNTVE
jgi:Abnormal spindle-like microcephaly-assoc'd, ASPM-SPD-2-Hydin